MGLAGAQMGLKYGFMSLFCIGKGQQEQEIIAEPLIYCQRRVLCSVIHLSACGQRRGVPEDAWHRGGNTGAELCQHRGNGAAGSAVP